MSQEGEPAGDGASAAVSWSEGVLPAEADVPVAREDVLRAVAVAGAVAGAGQLVVDVVFVSASELARMHGEFLGDPSETDVITFDLRDGEEGPSVPGPDGELYVSLDRARSEASSRGVPLARELLLYVVHGALHLCGFDDQSEPDRVLMRDAERRSMEKLGFAPDEGPHEARSTSDERS